MKRLVNARCRIALLGFGTVGSAVARRLTSGSNSFQLTHIFDRRAAAKRRALTDADVVWTARIEDVLESDADVVVEALGGGQGRQLRFEAAVGGAMPIVRAIGEGLAGDRITRITAILNATTNAVL